MARQVVGRGRAAGAGARVLVRVARAGAAWRADGARALAAVHAGALRRGHRAGAVRSRHQPLLGRARHVGGAIAMLVRVAPARNSPARALAVLAALAAALLLLRGLHRARRARSITPAMRSRPLRGALVGVAALAVLLFTIDRRSSFAGRAVALLDCSVSERPGRQLVCSPAAGARRMQRRRRRHRAAVAA